MTTLRGHLERITYRHAHSPFTIAKLRVAESRQLVTVTGSMPGVRPGDRLEIVGDWDTHPRYGQQFKARQVTVTPADPLEGIRNFLSSGFIKGLGPKVAAKLLAHFDKSILDVLDTAPERLGEVHGIGAAKAAQIAGAWKEHRGTRKAMLMLQALGMKPFYATRILKALGPSAVDIIRTDPYQLSAHIREIDFFLADQLARQLGMDPSDLRRLEACLLYLLEQATTAGHTCMILEALVARCAQLLEVPVEKVQTALEALAGAGLVVVEETLPGAARIYLGALYAAETAIACRLRAFLTVPIPPPGIDSSKIAGEVVRKLAIAPSDMQLQVLSEILSHRVVIITGGPGTGKTTLIRSVCVLFASLERRICLAAPTGRAARRLSEVTRRKAATIHRLLGSSPSDGFFEKNRDNPLDADVVIVDEASMVDVLLMHHLLEAVPMTAVLVLVGDAFQLPPVGPGNVLADLMASGAIPAFELTEIFRQAQESPIVMNAHRIRSGRMPDLAAPPPDAGSDFFFVETADPAEAARQVVDLCADVLPNRRLFDPVKDIQVLTPMHRGPAGTLQLNQMLQAALNPALHPDSPRGERGALGGFRAGDKVMHLKNNYQKDVFNGDIGAVVRVSRGAEQVVVDYDGREVFYAADELDELGLAYAISVHKSQGSEYPAVVVALLAEHAPLLQRNLLYTALTRGRRLVVLVGSRRAIETALGNDKPKQRLSGLRERF